MSILEKLNRDFMDAYKAKDTQRKNFLGLIKSEVTKESKDPTDAYIVSKLKSMIKAAQSTDSLSAEELDWMGAYLPTQMSDLELETLVQEIIESNRITSARDMGRVMAQLKSQRDGHYDGATASRIIKNLLK